MVKNFLRKGFPPLNPPSLKKWSLRSRFGFWLLVFFRIYCASHYFLFSLRSIIYSNLVSFVSFLFLFFGFSVFLLLGLRPPKLSTPFSLSNFSVKKIECSRSGLEPEEVNSINKSSNLFISYIYNNLQNMDRDNIISIHNKI